MGTIRAIWNGKMKFTITDFAGRKVVVDTDTEHGGEDDGIYPKQLMLMGLAGCTGMDVISILGKKRQPVTGFDVTVRGEEREEMPKLYDRVKIHYVIHGDVDDHAVERAIELSITKYCAVYATMKEVADISHSYRIIRNT